VRFLAYRADERVGPVRVSIVHLNNLTGPVRTPAAVVIDVMRAFTVAPWCFARGAAELHLARSVEDAVAAKRRWPDALLLKDGLPDPRFDLANAPGQLRDADLSGHTIVQVTNNGTRGAYAAVDAKLLLCAGFVTAGATVRALVEHEVDAVTVVVTEGDEDRALADYLAARLNGQARDAGDFLDRAGRSPAATELLRRGSDERYPGNHPDDAALCLQLDTFDFALRARPADGYLSVVKL
jgi:2-phosphosulfolactate phosphatase